MGKVIEKQSRIQKGGRGRRGRREGGVGGTRSGSACITAILAYCPSLVSPPPTYSQATHCSRAANFRRLDICPYLRQLWRS